MKQVIITIDAVGRSTIEAKGFNGVGCDTATQEIEIAIGGASVKKKTPKPERYVGTGAKTNTSVKW